jgi:homopolymeric O-antigen transport system ATP-binding protein
MSSAIQVEQLCKRYQLGQLKHETMIRETIVRLVKNSLPGSDREASEFWALRDVSLAVEQGEVLGLVGRNGAGKSTLLKILAKVVYPTSGRVQVAGRVGSLLEVGTGFHEELTGRENIYLNGSILGMRKSEIDAKMSEIVDFSGIEKFIDTPLKRYSSGMALRLGFSVAAHLETEILLVDEVLAVGDAEFQRKCLASMERSHRSGRTVVFVSHNLAAVENLCSRVIWVDNGRIRADGRPDEVINSYMSAFSDQVGSAAELDKIADRQGTGKIRFTALELLDQSRLRKPSFRSGDPAVFRIHFRVNEPVTFPYLSIWLYSEVGIKVAELSTWSSGVEISELGTGYGVIEVEVPFLSFQPGRYSISLCATDGRTQHDMLDHCASLNVDVSDYYGTGRGIDRFFGLVIVPCTWNLLDLPITGEPVGPRAIEPDRT